eukprot:66423_1
MSTEKYSTVNMNVESTRSPDVIKSDSTVISHWIDRIDWTDLGWPERIVLLSIFVMVISLIMGIVSFTIQTNIWSKYSAGYGDSDKINAICQNQYDEMSKRIKNRDGGDTGTGRDAGIDMQKLLIMNYILFGWVIISPIIIFITVKCKKCLISGCDAGVIAVTPPGFFIICLVYTWWSTRFLIQFVPPIEEYCDHDSDLYQTVIIQHKGIIFLNCISGYFGCILVCVIVCMMVAKMA